MTDKWQPIETAPTDGRMILATPCFGTSKQPYLIWWAVGRRCNKWRFGDKPITAKPTHWMPLPEPPKEAEE